MTTNGSYNLWNPDIVRKFLLEKAGGDERLAACLDMAIGACIRNRESNLRPLEKIPLGAPQWLVNKWDVCGTLYDFFPDQQLQEDVKLIADWLRYEIATKAPWLEATDEKGRCRKLLHATLKDMIETAKAWHFVGDSAPGEPKLAQALNFGNGFRMIELVNEAALTQEGKRMEHCLVDPVYRTHLATGHRFFSLRDQHGIPQATLQISPESSLLECRGRKNKILPDALKPCVVEFLRKEDCRINPHHAGSTGFIRQDNHLFDAFDLPDGLIVRGGLVYKTVKGSFTLRRGVRTDGAFEIEDCDNFEGFGGPIEAAGHVLVRTCKTLLSIDHPVRCGERFTVSGCPQLKRIAGPVETGNLVDCSGCRSLEEFPAGTIHGNLDLRGCEALRALSAGLHVSGCIDLRGCHALETLPPDLEAAGGIMWGDHLYKDVAAARTTIEEHAAHQRTLAAKALQAARQQAPSTHTP